MTHTLFDSHPGEVTDAIEDNAKRSVSIRINTSDYGRMKRLARRLRVRESVMFRYVMKAGLAELQPLLGALDDRRRALTLLAHLGPDLVHQFNLDTSRLRAVLERAPLGPRVIGDEELDLVVLAARAPAEALHRLATLLGRPIDAVGLRQALRDYLSSRPVDAD